MVQRIKILMLAANPIDIGYLPRLDREAREIDKKIQGGSKRDSFEVVTLWAVRPSDLQKALLSHAPHIVHFSGHGKKNEILLEDRDGNLTPVSKKALIELFRHLKDDIKIVFLNACHSRRQIDALREVIDFTIANNAVIDDKAAVIFSSHFYQALAFGRSVRKAFELAKNQLELEGIDGSKTPELLEREGADAAHAYLVKKPGASRTRNTGTKKAAGKHGGGEVIVASGTRSVAARTIQHSTVITADQYRSERETGKSTTKRKISHGRKEPLEQSRGIAKKLARILGRKK